MKYMGSCHCKNVKFEVDMEIESVMSCNCSICSKKGSLLAFAPEDKFKLISGEDSLSDYQFAKKVIHHYFCSNCGISCFGSGVDKEGNKVRAINVRCLDGVDFESIPVVKVDGKSF